MKLQGAKTLLREIEESDLAAVLAWRNSPRVHANMFTNHTITPGEHRRWFEGLKDRPDYKFLVIRDAATLRPAGVVNWTLDRANASCEIGIYIGEEDFQGRGLAGDAIETAVRHLFEKEGMSEIIAEVFEFNAQAVRFYEKHGFRADPSLARQCEKNGKPENVMAMKRPRNGKKGTIHGTPLL